MVRVPGFKNWSLFTAHPIYANASKSGIKNDQSKAFFAQVALACPVTICRSFTLRPEEPGARHVHGASAPAHPPQRGNQPRTVRAPRQCRRPAAPGPTAGPAATEPGHGDPATYPAGSRAPRNSGEAARARRLRGHDGDPGKRPARQGPRSSGQGESRPVRSSVRPPAEWGQSTPQTCLNQGSGRCRRAEWQMADAVGFAALGSREDGCAEEAAHRRSPGAGTARPRGGRWGPWRGRHVAGGGPAGEPGGRRPGRRKRTGA